MGRKGGGGHRDPAGAPKRAPETAQNPCKNAQIIDAHLVSGLLGARLGPQPDLYAHRVSVDLGGKIPSVCPPNKGGRLEESRRSSADAGFLFVGEAVIRFIE